MNVKIVLSLGEWNALMNELHHDTTRGHSHDVLLWAAKERLREASHTTDEATPIPDEEGNCHWCLTKPACSIHPNVNRLPRGVL